jgi:hypothetical protein
MIEFNNAKIDIHLANCVKVQYLWLLKQLTWKTSIKSDCTKNVL